MEPRRRFVSHRFVTRMLLALPPTYMCQTVVTKQAWWNRVLYSYPVRGAPLRLRSYKQAVRSPSFRTGALYIYIDKIDVSHKRYPNTIQIKFVSNKVHLSWAISRSWQYLAWKRILSVPLYTCSSLAYASTIPPIAATEWCRREQLFIMKYRRSAPEG
jgi:hypothetical protein